MWKKVIHFFKNNYNFPILQTTAVEEKNWHDLLHNHSIIICYLEIYKKTFLLMLIKKPVLLVLSPMYHWRRFRRKHCMICPLVVWHSFPLPGTAGGCICTAHGPCYKEHQCGSSWSDNALDYIPQKTQWWVWKDNRVLHLTGISDYAFRCFANDDNSRWISLITILEKGSKKMSFFSSLYHPYYHPIFSNSFLPLSLVVEM